MKTMTLKRAIGLRSLAAFALLGAAACGGKGAETVADKTGPVAPSGPVLSVEAANKFNAALESFNAHEKARDWSPGVCADVAGQFQAAAAQVAGGKLPAAI